MEKNSFFGQEQAWKRRRTASSVKSRLGNGGEQLLRSRAGLETEENSFFGQEQAWKRRRTASSVESSFGNAGEQLLPSGAGLEVEENNFSLHEQAWIWRRTASSGVSCSGVANEDLFARKEVDTLQQRQENRRRRVYKGESDPRASWPGADVAGREIGARQCRLQRVERQSGLSRSARRSGCVQSCH